MEFLVYDLVYAAQLAKRTQLQNEARNAERIRAEKTRAQALQQERERLAALNLDQEREWTPVARFVRSPTPPLNPKSPRTPRKK